MTDNEIITALEHCINEESCVGCPIKNDCFKDDNTLRNESLSLINRQKVKIERLEKGELSKAMKFNINTITNIRTEAIKEFAERLKSHVGDGENVCTPCYLCSIGGRWARTKKCEEIECRGWNKFDNVIDNIVKEMVGEDDA